MPQDKTADELRRRAAQIRSEAETAARRLDDAADLLERMPTVEQSKAVADSWALPSRTDTNTLEPMDTSGIVAGPQPSGPKFKSKHPLVKRAQELKRSMPV